MPDTTSPSSTAPLPDQTAPSAPPALPTIAEYLDDLPTTGVAAYVAEFAKAHGVSSARTPLDDWADTITRLCGDDVYSDQTTQLLVNLKRQNYLGARQFSRILINYLRERKAMAAGETLNS